MKNRYSEEFGGKRPAAPKSVPAHEEPILAAVVDTSGITRCGDLLVVAKGSEFPDRCPITNEPSASRYPATFRWNSPAAALAKGYFQSFAGFAIFGIASSMNVQPAWLYCFISFITVGWIANSMFTESAAFEIAYSDAYVATSRSYLAIAVTLIAAALGVIYLGWIYLPVDETVRTIGALSAVLILSWGCVQIAKLHRELRVESINLTHVWLRGAHPDFLAALPPSSTLPPS